MNLATTILKNKEQEMDKETEQNERSARTRKDLDSLDCLTAASIFMTSLIDSSDSNPSVWLEEKQRIYFLSLFISKDKDHNSCLFSAALCIISLIRLFRFAVSRHTTSRNALL